MLTFIFASVASITSHLSLRLRRCGKIIIFWWFDNRMFLWSLPNLSVSLRHSWGHCGTHMNPANMNVLMNIRKELVVFPIFPRKDTFSDDFGLILNNFFITSLCRKWDYRICYVPKLHVLFYKINLTSLSLSPFSVSRSGLSHFKYIIWSYCSIICHLSQKVNRKSINAE